MPRTKGLLLISAVVLLGFGLRSASWGRNRFVEDEALYASWGLLIASGTDPLLDTQPVDKPPLHAYALALSYRLFCAPPPATRSGALTAHPGGEPAFRGLEAAARLPSLFASTASIPLAYALARAVFRQPRAGAWAALLVSVSPLDIAFASTALTDSLMVALSTASVWAACSRRSTTAGVLAGLAVATKQQAGLYLPLVLAMGWLVYPRRRLRREWLRLLAGLLAVLLGLAAWDLARSQQPGFVRQGLANYGGLGLISASALVERGLAWLRNLDLVWGSTVFDALGGLSLLIWGAAALAASRAGKARAGARDLADQAYRWVTGRLNPAGVVLATSAVAYMAVLWLLSFQVWSRYLLGLVPILAVLLAGSLTAVQTWLGQRRWSRRLAPGLVVLVSASLVSPAYDAARGMNAVGGSPGAYDGIEAVAYYMRSQVPPGSVLYDHWLGYHYRFYLWEAPLRIHWYPDGGDLAQDALVYRREPRYIAFPAWHANRDELQALADVGVRLSRELQAVRRDGSVSIELYRLHGP